MDLALREGKLDPGFGQFSKDGETKIAGHAQVGRSRGPGEELELERTVTEGDEKAGRFGMGVSTGGGVGSEAGAGVGVAGCGEN